MAYIGVIDSGVGGLDILNCLRDSLKQESFYFIADNKHLPYGSKTKQQLEEYGIKLVEYLEKQDVKMIVVACNTLSLNAIDKMREHTKIPIYGIARPTVKKYLNSGLSSVLILGTMATIKSNRYYDFLKELDPKIVVYQQAAPKLVDYIESNRSALIDGALSEYIDEYQDKVDGIILGCTHYPIIKEQIKKKYPHLYISDSRVSMVELVSSKLAYHNIISHSNNREIILHASGSIEQMKQASNHFFDYSNVILKEGGIDFDE
jgi:glutamate racemase